MGGITVPTQPEGLSEKDDVSVISRQPGASTGVGITAQRAFFQLLVENVLDIVTVLNDGGIIHYESSSLERILGYEPAELIGKRFFEFIHPDDVLNVVSIFNDIMQIPGCTVSLEFRFQHKDSSWCTLEALGRNLPNTAVMTGIVLCSRDITERKQAEEELHQSFEKLKETLEGVLIALAEITEKRDPYIAGHQQRVTRLACAIAREMGLAEERIAGIRVAGMIHDIGKINIPTEVLRKPGKLSEIELALVKTHAQAGFDLLKATAFQWPVAQILLQHHERIDGSGYPRGLMGEDVLLEARILGVADVVEAMVSRRSYRLAFDLDEALGEIIRNKGILYDPEVVDACLKLFTEKGFTFEEEMSKSQDER